MSITTDILTAEYVVPITADVIRGGGVAIAADAIVAVGAADDLRQQFPEARVRDLGSSAILPGFVNCHSHLELTALRGAGDRIEHDFCSWLVTLTRLRAEVLDQSDLETGALAGAVEAARSGVTCVGDIGRFGRVGLSAAKAAGSRGIIFQETEFSPDISTVDVDFEKLIDKYLSLRAEATDLVEIGLSPHAPYTVSRKLFEKIARFAVDENVKVSIHAAESRDEDELMQNGRGLFATVYEQFGVEWQSPACSSIEFLAQTGILEAQPLLAHCVTVSDKDIEAIAATGSRVAHCPKSNAKFGHGYAPFEKLIAAGIAVGLGTDSFASNNFCDMLEESRSAAFAARNRAGSERFISALDVLTAATLGGARALGLDDRIGSIEAGKQADLTVIDLTGFSQLPVSDIYAALVFSSGARDVKMTMVAGRETFVDGRCLNVDEATLRKRLFEIGSKLQRNQS